MASRPLFPHTEPDLLPILEDLRRREPIFHTPEFGTTPADFEQIMADDYWEVGASGRRYSRNFILQALTEAPPVDAASAGWQNSGHALRRLGPDTYLFTYTLRQAERLTRRATIWQSTAQGWRILYHQGTIVTAADEQDDSFPPDYNLRPAPSSKITAKTPVNPSRHEDHPSTNTKETT